VDLQVENSFVEQPMNKEDLRAFETHIKDAFVQGKIRAPVHLADGNEEDLIEIFKEVKPTDWVFSAWRSHYHALLHGISPEWLEDQIVKGYSITLCNPEHRFYTSAMVGGIVPIALGAALSIKLKKETDRVWLFIGDMTYRTGVCHEAIKYATGHSLPITFVVEDNDISVQTPTREVWGENNVPDLTGPCIRHYEFSSSYPHVGAGEWVTF
jgi:TPP-dependent pyruvate/acetoin dehydrogenase alpha subunit